MNNKLFTFLDPLLGYIDNGRFFREPFRWLYVIFAVLNLLFPIFILAKVIEMDFFKYAEGKLILAFILLFIILCAGAWGSYLLWMNRKNKLKEAIQTPIWLAQKFVGITCFISVDRKYEERSNFVVSKRVQ